MGTTTDTLIPELQGYAARYEQAKQRAAHLVTGLTEDHLHWCPEPGSWSIAQCLDHLNVTGQQTLPLLRRGIDQAKERNWRSNGPFKHGFLGNWAVKSAGADKLPPKKFKAPQIFRPRAHLNGVKVVEEFTQLQNKLTDLLQEANGLDLSRSRVPSPALKLLKLDLGQWFALTAGHQERHLWQAGRVREVGAFGPQ